MKFKKNYKIIIAILLAVFIEIFICNFNAIKITFLSEDKKNIKSDFSVSEDKENIVISSINEKVYNVEINLKEDCNSIYTFKTLTYSIESPNQNTMVENQKTVDCINGEHKIIIKINNPYKISDIYVYPVSTAQISFENIEEVVSDVYLNVNSFEFNIIRTIILFLILLIIFYYKSEKLSQLVDTSVIANNKVFKFIAVFIAITISIYTCSDCLINKDYAIIDKEEITDVKKAKLVVYSIFRQTEAFLNGSLSIDADTSELETLDNPYDVSERDVNGTYYLFDIAYYNNKYYQYFSILINLFIIPFRLITGKYFDITIYSAMIMFVLILVASLFYKTVICKYIKKCSRFNFYLGYVTFLVATGLSALSRALAYDLQISFGQIFFMLAITILLKLENKTKHEYLLYMLLGIFTALIVVSKANMVVLYIPITYLYIKLLKEKKYSTSKLIKVLLSTFTLFTLIAIFQMVYNYIRFDSIFEFGTKYQLTVADMRYGTVLSLNRMMYGIMLALFTIPRFSIFEFPFISEGNVYVDVLGFNEYMFKHYTVGILAIPIIYVLFFKGKLKQNKENNESNNLLKIINIFIITSAIILCVDIIFAGMSDRYLIDIRVMLIISSILCVLKRLETLYKKDKQKYDLYQTLFYILALTSILVMLPIAITYEEAQVKLADLTFLKNMLMFWI